MRRGDKPGERAVVDILASPEVPAVPRPSVERRPSPERRTVDVSPLLCISGRMIVDGYVRVSQVRGRVGPSFISPRVQRDQIQGWIRANGAGLGRLYEELDESGGRDDRPMLLEAIHRIETSQSDGLVVAKLDRFGRSLVSSLRAIERIQRAGGIFVSVADGDRSDHRDWPIRSSHLPLGG